MNSSIRHSDGTVRDGKELGPDHLPDLQFDGADLRSIEIDHATHLNFEDKVVSLEGTFRLIADSVYPPTGAGVLSVWL